MGRAVAMPTHGPGNSETSDASGIIRLIVRMRHNEHRPSRAQRLRKRARAAWMHHRGRAREQQLMWSAVDDERVGTDLPRRISLETAGKEDGPKTEAPNRIEAFFIEPPGGGNGGAAEREHDGRRTRVEKGFQVRRQCVGP